MKTSLLTALALTACFFTTACDEGTDTDTDVQLAEMVEICEALGNDCDEAIEAYLAEVEDDQQAHDPGVDGPDDLWTRPSCTHCGEGRVDDLTNDGDAQPTRRHELEGHDAFNPGQFDLVDFQQAVDGRSHSDELVGDEITPDPDPPFGPEFDEVR